MLFVKRERERERERAREPFFINCISDYFTSVCSKFTDVDIVNCLVFRRESSDSQEFTEFTLQRSTSSTSTALRQDSLVNAAHQLLFS